MYFLLRLLLAFVPVKSWRRKLNQPVHNLIFGMQLRRRVKSCGKELFLRGYCRATKQTTIGDFVTLGGVTIFGKGRCIIGNHVQMGPEVLMLTQNHEYEGDRIPYSKNYILKDVVIDDCVWIGARVTILPGTHIGEGAIIQAGAVVHGEIPPCAIAGGNPAKVFSWRDKEHYKQLKREGKFLRGEA